MRSETAATPSPAAPPARGDGAGRRLEAWRGRAGALRHPLYRRYWLGSLGAVAGTQYVTLASGWLVVFGLGGSPLDLGWVGAATAGPTILVNLFGGVLADRMERRRLLMATSALSALLIGLLAVLDASGAAAIGHVVAISAALGLVYGVDWPVRNAWFPQLIDEEQMISAVALNSVMWQASRIASPALAGIAIALFGTAFVFAAAACGFAAMLLVLTTLPGGSRAEGGRRGAARELAEGVAFVARRPLFASLMLLTWAATFFGLSYIYLLPLMAAELGIGPARLGLLYSVLGTGAVSGTLLTLRLGGGTHAGRAALAGSFGSALCILLFAFSPAYPIAAALAWAAALCNSVFLVTSMTAMQLRTPEALRGRVMGIHAIAFSLIALGGLFGGAVALAAGVRAAVALGALLLAAATLAVALTQPAVRRLGAHPEPRAPSR